MIADVHRVGSRLPLRLLATGAAALVLVAASVPALPTEGPTRPRKVTVDDRGHEVAFAARGVRVVIERSPWRLRLETEDGRVVAREALPGPLDPMVNPDRAPFDSVAEGGDLPSRYQDIAYPGPDTVTYRPLAYRTGGTWHGVTGLRDWRVAGNRVRIEADTDDGAGASVVLSFARPGAPRLSFVPHAAGVELVEEAFDAPAGEAFLGGGQRFGALDQRGRSIPLWISHGVGSDRYGSTNEIVTPFVWSTGGWGLWADSDARGEMNVAVPSERPDALNVIVEDDRLAVVLYAGTPEEILRRHTVEAGRPEWSPPAWVWEPMVWQDEDNTDAAVREMVEGMQAADIPLGAVWVDNKWERANGDLDFDPARFPDPDGLIDWVHGRGVRFVTWVSPFVTGGSRNHPSAVAGGYLVDGTPPDGYDRTYFPPRRLSPHVDLTDPEAVEWWKDLVGRLVARGVDGVKADRGEEDLGEEARFASGEPNRLVHNRYVVDYDAALFGAFREALSADPDRDGDDFLVLARGGWTGSSRWAAQWAADNVSAAGPLGLQQALRALLSTSASGFPLTGSDVGGYVGTRESTGEGLPTRELFLRWAQLGALSPIMQTGWHPWDFDAETVRVYRRYARLHSALAPYTARWARAAITRGLPIVRPMAFAFPDDVGAVRVDDQYLYGPDLLVAPIHDLSAEGEVASRTVYLPSGGWTDFWTGSRVVGPAILTVTVPLDRMPLYVRDGAELPASLTPGAPDL